jgi:NAD(P)-dependent dehydrogenase (short-subunit alcohol dehydrogenase family)
VKAGSFRDQVAIVTGASAGIGRALALLLAQQGAKVAVAARRIDRLEQVAGECRRMGAGALAVPTDVSQEDQCRALVERSVAAFGRLDLLVCNAGIAATALLEEFTDLSLFRKTVDTNLYGAIFCTYYALPHLKQARGRIVAVSSLGGKTAIPYNTPYCASKYGMHGFYDALRMELSRSGVSVTVVCPWWVATEFHTAQLDKNGVPRGVERGKDLYTSRTMSAERCAQIILDAGYKRRREVVMGPGRLAVWLKMLAPGFLDWLSIKVFLEPAIRRAAKRRKDRDALA